VGSRVRAGVLTGLLLLATGRAPHFARAAHEWRSAWGSPYSLALLEEQAARPEERPRCTIALAFPFGLPGTSFRRAVLHMPGGWEAHAGMLGASGYSEWHVGCGWRFRPSRAFEALLGARLFAVRVGEGELVQEAAGTLIARLFPPGMALATFEAGLVDLPVASREPLAVPLLICRARVDGGRVGLILERAISPRASGETSLALLLRSGPLRFGCAVRCATGEGGFSFACRAGAAEVALADRWHPHLGWSPEVSLSWRREGADR